MAKMQPGKYRELFDPIDEEPDALAGVLLTSEGTGPGQGNAAKALRRAKQAKE